MALELSNALLEIDLLARPVSDRRRAPTCPEVNILEAEGNFQTGGVSGVHLLLLCLTVWLFIQQLAEISASDLAG